MINRKIYIKYQEEDKNFKTKIKNNFNFKLEYGSLENIENIKILDSFIFFNEIDIAYIHIKELYDVVDKFIIIESNKSFSGKSKELNFKNNIEKYNNLLDKILYFSIDMSNINDTNRWKYEFYQRESLQAILKTLNINSNTIILHSDVDEIIYRHHLKNTKSINTILGKHNIFFYQLYDIRYYLNYIPTEFITGTFLIRYKHFKNIVNYSINIRKKFCGHYSTEGFKNNFKNSFLIEKAGVHISFMGGNEASKYKIQSYSHSEYDNLNENRIDNIIVYNLNNHNSKKYRESVGFSKWTDFTKYYNLTIDKFIISDILLDEIKQNKEKYKHLFLFDKPYLE